MCRHASLVFFAALFFAGANAQEIITHQAVFVRSISIDGNRRTKPAIITRQLTFKTGDALAAVAVAKALELSRQNLLNIGLFTDASVDVSKRVGDSIDIHVRVYERWYTLPGITFDIYDRNFNTWWVEHERDPKRIQYGVRFLQQNMRGRDEDLTLTALLGYAQRFGFGYRIPYINRKMNKGIRVSAFLAQQRNIAYDNRYNKERFHLDPDRFIRRTYSVSSELSFTPGFHFRQQFAAGYTHTAIDDTIAKLNRDYFGNGATSQQNITLRSSTIYDQRDWVAYPFKGYYLEGTLLKTGIGLVSDQDLFTVIGVYQHYFKPGKRMFASYQLKGIYSLPARQPYYNVTGLGFRGDYVSGYEYYAVNGNAFALGKVQLKYRLFTVNIPVMQLLRKQDVKIPVHVLAKTFADAGYVTAGGLSLEKNLLADTWMTGTGVGIDVATAYDFAVKFEYSLNRKGEKGLFLHFSGSF